ncbi:hypothetical protein H6B14_02450 [Phocaeicola coprophilus]|nr:hypothetical protein [Phocaeicola coprophilus]
MKKEDLKTDEIVILIDANYLEQTGNSLREYFSHIVKRALPQADLPAWVESVTLDAGIRPGNHHIQVMFIHPHTMKAFTFCEPGDFEEELHCVAFKSNLGEFSFSSFSTESLTSLESMYADIAQTLSVSKGTQHIILVGNIESYGDDMVKALQDAKNREVYYFSINPLEASRYPFKFCNLGFSLLHALGVRSEELE